MPLAVARRGGEIELRGQAAGNLRMETADNPVPLALFVVRVVRLVVQHDHRAAAIGDAFAKILDPRGLRRRFRPQYRRQLFRLVVAVAFALVELLHVGQIQRTERPCPFPFAAHVALEIAPEDLQLRRNDGIGAENAAALEIRPQALEHDHVRGNQQKRLREIIARLRHCIEKLPGDGERHDLCLAATGRHLHGVAGKVVVLQEPQIAACGIGLDEALVPPHRGDLEQIDQRLDGFALEIMVGKLAPARQPVVGMKPVVQQDARGVGYALAAIVAPGGDLLADARHAGRGRDPRFEEPELLRVLFALAGHEYHLLSLFLSSAPAKRGRGTAEGGGGGRGLKASPPPFERSHRPPHQSCA